MKAEERLDSHLEIAHGGAARRCELDLPERGLDAQLGVQHRRVVEAAAERRYMDVHDGPGGIVQP